MLRTLRLLRKHQQEVDTTGGVIEMTKRWSSTASGDGKTKQEASKASRKRLKQEVKKVKKQIESGDFEEVDPMEAD